MGQDVNADFASDFGGLPLVSLTGSALPVASPTLVWYEIPLSGYPQSLSTTINGKRVTLVTHYAAALNGGWTLRMLNSAGAVVISGLALVPGVDLLAQYEYLGLRAILYLYSDTPDSYPTFSGLGTTSHLVWAATG